MIEQTLAIIKPDGVLKGVAQKIRQRYPEAGLRLIKEKVTLLEITVAKKLYREHHGKVFFEGLVLSMVSGPIVAILLEGEDAIKKVRALHGATDPAKAEPGTIRHDFRSAGGPFNTVHASDSPEAAAREIKLFFG